MGLRVPAATPAGSGELRSLGAGCKQGSARNSAGSDPLETSVGSDRSSFSEILAQLHHRACSAEA